MEGKMFAMIPGSQAPTMFLWGFVAFLGILTGLFVYLALNLNNVKFEITPDGLRIRAPLYGKFIPASELLRDEARILDLSKDKELRPSLRTNGLGLPGCGMGWFRLKNKEKALIFLTESSDVVYIPTNKGYSLLLSIRGAEDFLRALRQ